MKLLDFIFAKPKNRKNQSGKDGNNKWQKTREQDG